MKALQNRNEIISTERILNSSANLRLLCCLPTRGKKKKKKKEVSTSSPNPFGDTFLNSKKCPQLKADSQNATGAQGGQLPPSPPAGEARREFKIQPGSEPPSQLK